MCRIKSFIPPRSERVTANSRGPGTSRCLLIGKALFLLTAALRTGSFPVEAVQTNELHPDAVSKSCSVRKVTSLPGSHRFASEFIEAVATDSTRDATQSEVIWGLTADISGDVPPKARAMYISKSVDGGQAWAQVARVDSKYFNAGIGEGLRNGFFVAPDAGYFVITTQRGAFQVIPQSNMYQPLVIPIPGPRVPSSTPRVLIPKKPGEPLRANVVGMASDRRHLLIGLWLLRSFAPDLHVSTGLGWWLGNGRTASPSSNRYGHSVHTDRRCR